MRTDKLPHEAMSDGLMTSSLDSIKIQSTNIVDTEKIVTVAEKAVRNLLAAKTNEMHAFDTYNVSNNRNIATIDDVVSPDSNVTNLYSPPIEENNQVENIVDTEKIATVASAKTNEMHASDTYNVSNDKETNNIASIDDAVSPDSNLFSNLYYLYSPFVEENKQLKNIVDTEKIATVAEKAVRNLLSAKSNEMHVSGTHNVSNDKETRNIASIDNAVSPGSNVYSPPEKKQLENIVDVNVLDQDTGIRTIDDVVSSNSNVMEQNSPLVEENIVYVEKIAAVAEKAVRNLLSVKSILATSLTSDELHETDASDTNIDTRNIAGLDTQYSPLVEEKKQLENIIDVDVVDLDTGIIDDAVSPNSNVMKQNSPPVEEKKQLENIVDVEKIATVAEKAVRNLLSVKSLLVDDESHETDASDTNNKTRNIAGLDTSISVSTIDDVVSSNSNVMDPVKEKKQLKNIVDVDVVDLDTGISSNSNVMDPVEEKKQLENIVDVDVVDLDTGIIDDVVSSNSNVMDPVEENKQLENIVDVDVVDLESGTPTIHNAVSSNSNVMEQYLPLVEENDVVDTSISVSTIDDAVSSNSNVMKQNSPPVEEKKQLENIVDVEKIATVAEKAVRNLLSVKSLLVDDESHETDASDTNTCIYNIVFFYQRQILFHYIRIRTHRIMYCRST